ncbi:hypothetical protein GOBAR_AA15794 [Gossypium barbadense]|uniref:Uncharacterized protein n=1 Tax=Gossypium barbadense TaxID=3634 RepID=A0A2P5XNG6_GOSBA|nr:hypothetical protein GOBAR_AA15794 [Gossypium barbadense]
MEVELAQLTINEEEEEILQIEADLNTNREVREFQLVGCFLTANSLPSHEKVFLEYDGSNLGKENRNYMRVRVHIDIRCPLKRKKVMCYGRGHSDSFYEAKMTLGVEIAETGWDLSRRAASINSIWLREEGEGKREGSWQDNRILGNRSWDRANKERSGTFIDPILGFNIKGGVSSLDQRREKPWLDQMQTAMDHDLEYSILIGEEGKKRNEGR